MSKAVIFPGQGAQSVGMLDDFDDGLVGQTLQEASDVLGYDIGRLISEGPEAELNQTRNTQPAVLTASVALWRIAVDRHGLSADYLAGHSLGEYTALVAAGSIAFADAVRLVAARGDFMQQYAPTGAGMVAVIGLDDAAVEAMCLECPKANIWPANYNAPGQVVVAGVEAALDWVEEHAKAAYGARMVSRLAMSVPSHCPLLHDAAEALAPLLDACEIMTPGTPVVGNVDAVPHGDADAVRGALRRQLCEPVRWTQTQQFLAESGVTRLVECGPGKVLSGLAKRSLRGVPCLALGADGMAQLDTR